MNKFKLSSDQRNSIQELEAIKSIKPQKYDVRIVQKGKTLDEVPVEKSTNQIDGFLDTIESNLSSCVLSESGINTKKQTDIKKQLTKVEKIANKLKHELTILNCDAPQLINEFDYALWEIYTGISNKYDFEIGTINTIEMCSHISDIAEREKDQLKTRRFDDELKAIYRAWQLYVPETHQTIELDNKNDFVSLCVIILGEDNDYQEEILRRIKRCEWWKG